MTTVGPTYWTWIFVDAEMNLTLST